MKVKVSANRQTGKKEKRKKRCGKRKEFARRNFQKTLEEKVAFIYYHKNNESLFILSGTRSKIMAGIVITIGDRDDDDSGEIKMGDDAESAPLSKNDKGNTNRFALREEWSSFGNGGT